MKKITHTPPPLNNQNLYCTKDLYLALAKAFNISMRESGYKRNQEAFDELVSLSYLITYSGW